MKRPLALLVAVGLVLGGCAFWQKPTGRISFDRAQVVSTYAKMKVITRAVVPVISQACATGVLDEAACLKAADAYRQLKGIGVDLAAKIEQPEVELDGAKIEKALGLMVDVVGALVP